MPRRLRHSRAAPFEAALDANDPANRISGPWSNHASDPNSPEALVARAETLRAAWRSPIADRAEHLVQRCRDKRVLDIGCVAHDVARMQSPTWLHGRIATAAEACLGVDVLKDGVAAMQSLGYDAVVHDLGQGVDPLRDRGPFDVIVAGELIEHVASMDMLFATANALLTADGCLLVTTPNAFAPNRVAAGQRGIVWENADHILYAFPSGIAELAERHGLVLAEAATTTPRRVDPRNAVGLIRQSIAGRQWMSVGYTTNGERSAARAGSRFTGWIPARSSSRRRFLGETFVYAIRRPPSD